ncbi:MAG: hypothetical protein JO250_04380 [Armatimonadetes bacterium]|nr:hypothetical protein [Armatimonadota bacterium]
MATVDIKPGKRPPARPGPMMSVSGRTRLLGILGLLALGSVLFLSISIKAGGHMMGPTYIAPGNVGLVIDNYHGRVAKTLPAGLHWQGLWETIIEVPTAQRTITLTNADTDASGQRVENAVQVNTISNMLQVDVSAQYRIDSEKADDLYASYQDQFADLRRFEAVNLEPALKEAINYAIGDMDTATALTTAGKQRAEQEALGMLNGEWEPRGIVFSQLMIRGIEQDQASKDLLSTTLSKMQEIENAKLALQQQRFDNATLLTKATAEAQVNRLQNSTLTDLYVQDQLLGQVKRLYLPSDQLMEIMKK